MLIRLIPKTLLLHLATSLLVFCALAESAWADNVVTRWVVHAQDVVRATNQSTQAADASTPLRLSRCMTRSMPWNASA